MPDELLVVGSASATPTRRRFPSAYALSVTGKLFLVDCGAPVSTLLYYYGLDPIEVEAVFLSHWHMDHVANLGLFLHQNHQRKRTKTLNIYGPRGTRGKINRLLADSFMVPEDLSYPLKITNIKPGQTHKQALLRVTFFKTQHLDQQKLQTHFGNKAIACGMVLNGPGWRIVYSGDCKSPTELTPYVKGCDLLIHEMAHHQPEDVAVFAETAKIPYVLISHLDPKFDEAPQKIEQAFAKHYSGRLIVAEDGTKVKLSHLRKKSTTAIQPPEEYQPQATVEQDPAENPNTIFIHKLQNDFDLSPAISHQILQTAKEILFGQTTGQVGKVGVVVANLHAPATVPLTYMDRVEVTLTIDAGSEDAVVELEEGVTGLRQGRVLRLLEEALEQEGVLTQEDLAWILNVNIRTIRRDIQILREEGHPIYTRGQLKEDEPIQLYKVRAIEMWLNQQQPADIARWLHHSPQAIRRYIDMFLKTVRLYRQEKTVDEIMSFMPVSVRLVQGYLNVYQAALTKPEWQHKLQKELAQTNGGV